MTLKETGVVKLEPEPQDGPTEYKLHMLLRPRRGLLSMSTLDQSSTDKSPSFLLKAGIRSTGVPGQEPTSTPTAQARQTRLQQLTTQLLWRLQQSSPFHSGNPLSQIAQLPDLVGAGTSRASRLLPGLEESQGALYEIGVSDDGTFVGLTQDELDESLANLEIMASTLGCDVQVLRRVVVGTCEYNMTSLPANEVQVVSETLWVAEALVRPNLDRSSQVSRSTSLPGLGLDVKEPPKPARPAEMASSAVDQIRVSITGASTSGKSSLLGVLTTSTLDNGRGKSRLNLLKHPHEVASGITSSVSQEVIGYRQTNPSAPVAGTETTVEVINYASENVSSWNDIHGSSSRLVFLSDSPGAPRYAKSCLRTLVSWAPHWAIVCVAANSGEDAPGSTLNGNRPDQTDSRDELQHLNLCLKLEIPILLVVTKMDVATKTGLRQTLSRLLTAVKGCGRTPVLLAVSRLSISASHDRSSLLQHISSADHAEVDKLLAGDFSTYTVPILLTSAVDGQGLRQLHALLHSLPVPVDIGTQFTKPRSDGDSSTLFRVDEVFAIPPSKVYESRANHTRPGAVFCGYVSTGIVRIGDELSLGPFDHANDELAGEGLAVDSNIQPQPPQRTTKLDPLLESEAHWSTVRVVSLRNLRLPTQALLPGQVGTIGVEPTNPLPTTDLRRGRKGMVLTSRANTSLHTLQTFTAIFAAADFRAQTSPPLILGGFATVYIHTVRARVRVTAVALEDSQAQDAEMQKSEDEGTVFPFDGDGNASGSERRDVRISFRFQSGVEVLSQGDRVLVVPHAVAAGPVTGGPFGVMGALGGFVGKVCGLED